MFYYKIVSFYIMAFYHCVGPVSCLLRYLLTSGMKQRGQRMYTIITLE